MHKAYRIYPSIGIARVGDSQTESYFGPETYLGLPTEIVGGKEQPITSFRDSDKRVKRQAARFYIYGFDDTGKGTRVHIGQDDIVDIEWTVHIANKKAIWYQFEQLQGEQGYEPSHPLRNKQVTDPAQRKKMMIDPGPRTIHGPNARAEFSRGTAPSGYPESFPPKGMKPFEIDTLGEIRTDEVGRLLVLGGHGSSGTTDETPVIKHYANNENWWDDTSDGSISATIVLKDGQKIQAEAPAWVIVAPPGYAPQIPNIVTLYEVMFDVAVRAFDYRPAIYKEDLWQEDYKPSWESEIQPVLSRPELNHWVSPMPQFAHLFDMRSLGNPDPQFQPQRDLMMAILRNIDQVNVEKNTDIDKFLMPLLCGDNPISNVTVSKYLSFTPTQYFLLEKWGQGQFQAAASNTKLPEWDQLSKAVLQNCVGGAFCPGIETTWISRNSEIYCEPFRIKARPVPDSGLDLGEDLSLGLQPGDLAKRMALPWQADFNECSDQTINQRTIIWWPAQRPMIVQLENMSEKPWARGIPPNQGNTNEGDLVMVSKWKDLGFVKNVGPDNQPRYIEVERNDGAFPNGEPEAAVETAALSAAPRGKLTTPA